MDENNSMYEIVASVLIHTDHVDLFCQFTGDYRFFTGCPDKSDRRSFLS